MNETLLLYLFTRINTIHAVTTIGLIIMGFLLLFWNIWRSTEENKPIAVPVVWRIVAGIAIAILVFVPREKDLAIIIGGTYALEIARSPEAKEISGLVLDVIRNTLKEKK